MSIPRGRFLQMENINKRFGRVVANDGATIDVREGEIYALIGENGAAKAS